MLSSRVDVGVSENICYEVNVGCLPVQAGTVGAAQLVRGNVF